MWKCEIYQPKPAAGRIASNIDDSETEVAGSRPTLQFARPICRQFGPISMPAKDNVGLNFLL